MARWFIMVAGLAIALFGARALDAAEVSFNVAPRETYVGVPVTLTMTITDAVNAEPPQLPDIDGFLPIDPPSRSEQTYTQIINGKASTTRSVAYTYRLVPERVGALVIPELSFTVDGQPVTTGAVTITVREAVNDGVLSAEIISPIESVYVGAPVQLTLRITVTPFHDDQYDITLSDQNMWWLVRASECRWGVFQPAIEQMNQARRRPATRTIRSGDDGGLRYQYEITQTVFADAPGALDTGNVLLVWSYPERLRRDVFGQLGVDRARPVTVVPTPPRVQVRALPENGKPELFAGAVGSFTMDVAVKPVEAAVGEPITLTLTIRDVGKPGAQLETLKAPPLHRLDSLTRGFRVHDEPLAGDIRGKSKVFTQTIRAQNEFVDAVPAIPFSFFDPARGEYVTITSDPIPLTIRPVSTMSMTDIVHSNGVTPRATELTPLAGGILANVTDTAELLKDQSLRWTWWMTACLVAPPMLCAAAALARQRTDRLRSNPASLRKRGALRKALQMLDESAGTGAGVAVTSAQRASAAVIGFVADRCNLPPGAHTSADVAACFAARGVDAGVTADVVALLKRCDMAAYTGGGSVADDAMLREARAIISRLDEVLR